MEMVGKCLLTCTVPSTADGDQHWPSEDKTYPPAYTPAHALDQGWLMQYSHHVQGGTVLGVTSCGSVRFSPGADGYMKNHEFR
jgi:hypothetical protein